MQKIEILITTYKKTDDEAIDIVRSANIFTDCIIRNQCGRDEIKKYVINGFNVLYVCSSDIGLSKNRNELLKLASAQYVMFLDDDCVIKKCDVENIEKYMTHFDIVFNECISLNKNRSLPVLKNHKRNNKFKYYSSCGVVGCLLRTKFLRSHCLFFDESIGSGTKLLCGEDSVFINEIISQKGSVGVSNYISIEVAQDASLWFDKTTSKEYVFAKGYLYKRLYKSLWLLYGIRFLHINAKKFNFFRMFRTLINGSRFVPDIKKIGVFSICDNSNYGNRLQNFALTYYLNANFSNVKAKTFKYVCTEYSFFGLIKNYFKIINDTKFSEFNNALPSNKRIIKRGFRFDSLKDIDCIVVGSDQIWNEQYFGAGIETNMLKKCKKIKKITYAVSVGKTDRFIKKINQYYDELQKFDVLSFREDTAIDVINNQYDLNACHNIDPVLLLDQETWLSMACSDNNYEEDFVFIYFLNKAFNTLSLAQYEFGNVFSLEGTNLHEYKSPFDLVKAIANSKYIFTDSYHIFLFSLILNKIVYLFVRDDSSDIVDDRFLSIISLFELTFEKRIINSKTCYIFDFSKKNQKLSKKLSEERERTFNLFAKEFANEKK